ncbi:ImmA/IrrE family metallo-endopeptidase [Roseovarius nubinhibens]|uniref:ImmA/IrrE family metallo-endopeptidase n=1 Tax=Roseovarius nubinhibens TaxID=314263 RepID=UPI001C096240|nr:ImmA/IrrE family metallo-endopeptidase [Roseovarius nubinhibens]MBU2999178.1 ImmA/IrrE family metallo-endopeptidase [Roseovarius nubinhibens]
MNTTEKGNKLEDQLFDYLSDQLERGELVIGVYPAMLCEVHKKKKYFCKEREADVEFDVAIEIRAEGRSDPHMRVIFECKNHKDPVQERDIRDFSDKINGIFKHGAKGMVVTSSRLQSGAERIARNRGLGIVKFDENGIDIVADRSGRTWAEDPFVRNQIIDGPAKAKSLKFSACNDGKFFGSLHQLLRSFAPEQNVEDRKGVGPSTKYVAFRSDAEIRAIAQNALGRIQHNRGAVDLAALCAKSDLQLKFSEQLSHDSDGHEILGTANFTTRTIQVNLHSNKFRERFTIAHEVGHFLLRHDNYLYSDSIIENDLLVDAQSDGALNYERLESQANIFASELLLPERDFQVSVQALRVYHGTVNKGFGYIFVDDQPCNYEPYNLMISALSNHFEVSKQAIEIRIKKMGLVQDDRANKELRKLSFRRWT